MPTTVTDVVAWWGAATGTLVLAWDIYKWKAKGPQVHVQLSPNMQAFGGAVAAGHIDPNKTFVVVTVSNNGDRPTTVTLLAGAKYRSVADFRRGKAASSLVCAPLSLSGGPAAIPYVLRPGEQWTVMLFQDALEKEIADGWIVALGVTHSGGKMPVFELLPLDKPAEPRVAADRAAPGR